MALPAGATIERGGDVVTLDAAERPRDWSALVEDLFLINKLQTGRWPAVLVVRNVPRPRAFDIAQPHSLWGALAERDLTDSAVTMHDLVEKVGLSMPISKWAQLRRRRDSVGASTSSSRGPATDAPDSDEAQPPAGVGEKHWATLMQGGNVVYLSAAEAHEHAPELADAFNAHAAQACLMRYLPQGALCEQNFGPILMDAEKGADSGWHRDGSRTAVSKAGDVNAFHWHVVGKKTWHLWPQRHEAAVTEFMKSRRRTTTNAFGNLVAELDSVVDFVRSKDGSAELITVESTADTVLVLGKHVWHRVATTERSISVTADRLLVDHFAEHLQTLDAIIGRPLVPAKWAAHEAAVAMAAEILHGGCTPDAVQRLATAVETLRPILYKLWLREASVASREPRPLLSRGGPGVACSSCDRQHASVRYCHQCGTELYNCIYECSVSECPWEACLRCHRGRSKGGETAPSELEARGSSPPHSPAQLPPPPPPPPNSPPQPQPQEQHQHQHLPPQRTGLGGLVGAALSGIQSRVIAVLADLGPAAEPADGGAPSVAPGMGSWEYGAATDHGASATVGRGRKRKRSPSPEWVRVADFVDFDPQRNGHAPVAPTDAVEGPAAAATGAGCCAADGLCNEDGEPGEAAAAAPARSKRSGASRCRGATASTAPQQPAGGSSRARRGAAKAAAASGAAPGGSRGCPHPRCRLLRLRWRPAELGRLEAAPDDGNMGLLVRALLAAGRTPPPVEDLA